MNPFASRLVASRLANQCPASRLVASRLANQSHDCRLASDCCVAMAFLPTTPPEMVTRLPRKQAPQCPPGKNENPPRDEK